MIHGVVEEDHHTVVDDGIIISVVLVMVHGVRLEVGDLTEVEITMVGVVVRGVPMGVGEDIMDMVVDPMGVVEIGVVGGMGVDINQQDGKVQEVGEEAGIGIGQLQDGMETRTSGSMATVLHHHLVTEKVSISRNIAIFTLIQNTCIFVISLTYQFQKEN
jgi:hypothetical protein